MMRILFALHSRSDEVSSNSRIVYMIFLNREEFFYHALDPHNII